MGWGRPKNSSSIDSEVSEVLDGRELSDDDSSTGDVELAEFSTQRRTPKKSELETTLSPELRTLREDPESAVFDNLSGDDMVQNLAEYCRQLSHVLQVLDTYSKRGRTLQPRVEAILNNAKAHHYPESLLHILRYEVPPPSLHWQKQLFLGQTVKLTNSVTFDAFAVSYRKLWSKNRRMMHLLVVAQSIRDLVRPARKPTPRRH